MSTTGSFDWFQLSKTNQKQTNISSFADLIKHAHFGEELTRVPLSLRKKLLITFQTSSNQIKNGYLESQSVLEQLQLRKKAIVCNIGSMKQELQSSMLKIKSDKTVIDEKKKLIVKMKQRLKKKQDEKKIAQKRQVFYCPLCSRQDFSSRQQFSFHIIKQHSQKSEQQNKQTFPAQIKELILSLKDKQIELMQMMLQKKKQMQTMQLQKLYELQIKKIKTQANFQQRKSIYTTQAGKKIKSEEVQENEVEQLKGQSQYLFYQSESNNRKYQKQVQDRFFQNFYRHASDIQPRTQRSAYEYYGNQRNMRKEQDRRDYYNIFGEDNAVSVESSLSPQRIAEYSPNINQMMQIPDGNTQMNAPKTAYFQQNSFNQKSMQPHPQTQIKSQLYRASQGELVKQQNRLRQENKKSNSNSQSSSYLKSHSNSNVSIAIPEENRKYESVYKQKSRISVKSDQKGNYYEGHIFNSGPLMDEDGGDSDYEDYFGREEEVSNDEVVDEEIKAIKPKSTANYNFSKFNTVQYPQAPSQKPCQNISNTSNSHALQYSKDRSYLQVSKMDLSHSHSHSHSHQKQKSSDMIQLSNSFSKRADNSSKNNDETINLSDLKLSKLQKNKQGNKKYYESYQNNSRDQSGSLVQLKNPHFHKINQRIFAYVYNGKKYEGNSSILEEFRREENIEELQYRMKNLTVNRSQRIQTTETQRHQAILQKLKSTPQNIQLMKTNPKVLEEFMYKPN